ncbi:hypothetical protein F4824DRAFT_476001 [Ustulina deusta]|nr:hypothetical protein F4824DRAFT_476001 [Ustulina deusta]
MAQICPSCHRLFESKSDLEGHVRRHQSRISRAAQEVNACQSRLAQSIQVLLRSLSHSTNSSDNEADEDDSDTSGSSNDEHISNSDEEDGNETDSFGDNILATKKGTRKCPESGCNKGPFTRKELKRHYDVHVLCLERCAFCGKKLKRVSQIKRHHSECRELRAKKNLDSFRDTIREAKERRDRLYILASKQLRFALQLSTENVEGTSEDRRAPRRAKQKREREREMEADIVPSKRGRATDNNTDTDRFALTPILMDASTMACPSDNVDMRNPWLNNTGFEANAPIITSHNFGFSPSVRDFGLRENEATQSDYSYLPPMSTEADYMSLGSSATDHLDAALAPASLLYTTASLPRAPTLSVHTVDGTSSYPTMPLSRAPTLSVHTFDGPSLPPGTSHYTSMPHQPSL